MSNSNFLWILKSSLFNTSRLFASFGQSNYSVSSKKQSGVNYQRLSSDDDNNNQSNKIAASSRDNSKTNIKKSCSQYSQQSIDDPHSINDSVESDSDDDDADDRLTCWVCERSFGSIRILQRHKIHERHFGCGTCEAIFPNEMALESHQEATDHWSDADDDDDDESIEELSDDSALDTEDEIEIDRKAKDPLKKERVFLL